MRRMVIVAVTLLAAVTPGVRGQEVGAHARRLDKVSGLGAGPILDWIHRLSGPEFGLSDIAFEISYGYQHRPNRSGRDPQKGWKGTFRHVTASDSADIQMTSYSLSLEHICKPKWKIYIGFEGGVAAHRFQHPDFEDFVQWSFPFLVNWYPAPYGVDVPYLGPILRSIRLSGGGHVFLPFKDDAFAPAFNWRPGGTEFVGTFMISVDGVRFLY